MNRTIWSFGLIFATVVSFALSNVSVSCAAQQTKQQTKSNRGGAQTKYLDNEADKDADWTKASQDHAAHSATQPPVVVHTPPSQSKKIK
jgi:hypothetical protein